MADTTVPQPALSSAEIARYSRHLTLPEVGVKGQVRLRDAAVLLVGAGGLGAPLGMYLAAAGVGRIGIVDDDRVELSNLQRQVLYDSDAVGESKVALARRRLVAINPLVRVDAYDVRFDAGNAADLLAPYDLVIDGTDNFPTRYLVNDACVLAGKPNVYGSIFRFEGQVSVFGAPDGPCYRCLFPEPPAPGAIPNCAEGGVLGVLPGIIGTLQATETIKWIIGAGEPLVGRLLLFNALEMRFREMRLRRDPECPVCGDDPSIRTLTSEAATCATTPQAPSATGETVNRVVPSELKRLLDSPTPPLVLDVRTQQEWQICRIDGALLIPLHELPSRIGELDSAATIVTYCHHGQRSQQAAGFLQQNGFEQATDLVGGIDRWATEIDPALPRY